MTRKSTYLDPRQAAFDIDHPEHSVTKMSDWVSRIREGATVGLTRDRARDLIGQGEVTADDIRQAVKKRA